MKRNYIFLLLFHFKENKYGVFSEMKIQLFIFLVFFFFFMGEVTTCGCLYCCLNEFLIVPTNQTKYLEIFPILIVYEKLQH